MIPYVVSKLAIALISPLGSALLLSTLGLLLLRKARVVGTFLLVLGIGWLWLWSTPAMSDSFLQHLENRYPAREAASLPKADAIVLIGGAAAPPGHGAPYPDLGPAADRIWHAARVFRAGKAPLLVCSGGSDARIADMPEAQVMAGLLQELGVPASAILQERDSRTTRENALFTAKALQGRNVHTILLVTSALHMRRAVTEFERVGFRVIPAATDHSEPRFAGVLKWVPDTLALDEAARALKEIVGTWVAARG